MGGNKKEGVHTSMCECKCCPIPRPHIRSAQRAWHATPLSKQQKSTIRKTKERKGKTVAVTYLLVSLAEGTLLERLADIFAPAREEPGATLGVVHEKDFAGGRLHDDHARAKLEIVHPETAVRDRTRRVFRV